MKTKLVADKASNMTRIGVTTVNGTVYLSGVADTAEGKAHAEALGVAGLSDQLLGPG